ncbi:MAG: TetR/AcrR family transcriptional regulator [Acidobacteriota bacterium]|nr:TetR/AcrR family transcriptional regulator [Acidobacteriota bacterium]
MPSTPRPVSLVRDRIVEAAVRMFAQHGYHGTSTREIARAAKVNENTLFRHFLRKEDLFWLALQSCLESLEVEKGLQRALEAGGDPEVLVRAVMEVLVGAVDGHPETIRLLSVAWLELNGKFTSVFQQSLAPVLVLLRECLSRSVRNPRVKAADPSLLTSALMASVLVHGSLSRLMSGGERPVAARAGAERQRVVEAYSNFWLSMLDGHAGNPLPPAIS